MPCLLAVRGASLCITCDEVGLHSAQGCSPRQISHDWPSGFFGGGWEQDFSTTRHQGGMLELSWMQPPWEWKVVPLAVVQL